MLFAICFARIFLHAQLPLDAQSTMLESRSIVVLTIFGKVGRIASEEVILQLIKSKCIPVLLYGLEACPLTKSDLSAIDFVVNCFFMKLFRTNNIETVKSFQPLSLLWSERVKNLIINMTYLLVVCFQYKLSIHVNKCCHCIGLHCSRCNFI